VDATTCNDVNGDPIQNFPNADLTAAGFTAQQQCERFFPDTTTGAGYNDPRPHIWWEGCKYQSTYTPTLELVSAEAAGLKTAQIATEATLNSIMDILMPGRGR